MDSYKLFGFVGILGESIEVLSKSGKLMAFTATVFLLLYSLLFLCNIFSTKPLISDLLIKKNFLLIVSPRSLGFANLLLGKIEDIRILLAVEWAFILAYSIVILFSSTATIIISAITYNAKIDLSAKDLLSRVARSLIRPFMTSFHVTLVEIGYTFCVTTRIEEEGAPMPWPDPIDLRKERRISGGSGGCFGVASLMTKLAFSGGNQN